MQQIHQIQYIALSKLVVSPLNTRKDLQAGEEEASHDDLVASIRDKGVLSPLLVRTLRDGRDMSEVIAGGRRLRACQQLSLDAVPCFVRDDLSDEDAVVLSIVENHHRADVAPRDKASAFKMLFDRYQSYSRVAAEANCSVATVRRYIDLLMLPEELQQKLGTADGSSGVGVMSRLASTFSGDAAIEVYEKTAGFNSRVRAEIIQRSEGDLSKVDDLVAEAHEGAFDVIRCGGKYRCEFLRSLRHLPPEEAKNVVHEFLLANAQGPVSEKRMREAERAVWKALALG
jgi:ParB/RepB/Spo0J family partition protein